MKLCHIGVAVRFLWHSVFTILLKTIKINAGVECRWG